MDAFDPNAHDLAALQGVWQQVAFEENGVADRLTAPARRTR